MFKKIISEMIDAKTLGKMTQIEIEKLNKELENNIVNHILEVEEKREYLGLRVF